ncbi:MAG: hypothetical protein FJZ00_00175 [Candidatus Sericytochromatia bacterium]|uniref:Uncharacterized protein n=1 Tax=Candidatus Tanganyikabacteria bacterium TaxID=2961651 RepID=A0A937X044_9BACT|nr:hypothetical protein [Candidatus Tanganyikabacteria bacterium]
MPDDKPASLDDTLSRAYDAMQEAPAEPAVEPVAAVEEAPAASPQPRGPDGRFTRAQDAERAEPAPQAPAPDAGKQDLPADRAEPVAPVEAASSAPTMPTSWSADAKAAWASLPPAVQMAVSKREAEVSAGFKSYSEKVREFDPVLQAIQPVLPYLSANGISPGAYLARLSQIDQFLRAQPVEGVRWIMQGMGLTPDHLIPTPGDHQQQPAEPEDPRISRMQQELDGMAGYLQQQRVSGVVNEIEAFRRQPGHEMLDQLRPQMAQLLSSGMADSLDDAYQKAMWMSPETRGQLMQADEAKRTEAARKAADEARRAKVVNVKSAGIGAGATPQARTIDETLNAAFERIQARG